MADEPKEKNGKAEALKTVSKWLGLPAGVVAGIFVSGQWVSGVEHSLKEHSKDIRRQEVSLQETRADMRELRESIMTVLANQIAVQQRLGVSDDQVKKIKRKLKTDEEEAAAIPPEEGDDS